jgi:cytoskeletal protein CcmA (bactofilin family)
MAFVSRTAHLRRRLIIMQNGAHIGSTLVIKGEITAREALSIAGRVDGTIEVEGQNVTVEAGAHVHADISASGIVVAGEVKGTLSADARIQLRAGANVEGDITAPRIVVEDGAFVRGKVHVSGQPRVTMVA